MPRSLTLNTQTLIALGPRRLAELLLDLAGSDPAIKRRIRQAVANATSPREQRRAVLKDLTLQLEAITGPIVQAEPAAARELLWQFLELGNNVLGRCDDSSGLLGDVFRQAMGQLGRLTEAAPLDPAPLAEQVFEVFCDNGYEVSTWERLYKPRMALLLKTAKGSPAARDATTCWKPRLISGANAMAAAPDGSRFSTQQRCCAGCQRRASASPLGSAT